MIAKANPTAHCQLCYSCWRADIGLPFGPDGSWVCVRCMARHPNLERACLGNFMAWCEKWWREHQEKD